MKRNVIIKLEPDFLENEKITKAINKHVILPLSSKLSMHIFNEESLPPKEPDPESFNTVLKNCEILISDDTGLLKDGEALDVSTIFQENKENFNRFEDTIVNISRTTQAKYLLEKNPNVKNIMKTAPIKTAKICLSMIVKDESKIIEKCLRSVAPHIDCYVICDTGSTDDTKEKITKVMDEFKIPGNIHDIEFRDFGYARNKALEFAKQSEFLFDYILLDDADMELEVKDQNWREGLTGDYYSVVQKAHNGTMVYNNVRLVKRDIFSKYVGVTHEFIQCKGEMEMLNDILYVDYACGSSRKEKFPRDIKLLEKALKEEPEGTHLHARYTFYLGKTYFESKDFPKGIKLLEKRAKMREGYRSEAYFSWYLLGRAHLLLGNEKEMLNAFINAYELEPSRVEPVHELAVYYRLKEKYHLAYMFSRQATSFLGPPKDTLFISAEVYQWRRWDELALSSYWVGRFKESLEIYSKLLEKKVVPKEEVERMKENIGYAKEKLSGLST